MVGCEVLSAAYYLPGTSFHDKLLHLKCVLNGEWRRTHIHDSESNGDNEGPATLERLQRHLAGEYGFPVLIEFESAEGLVPVTSATVFDRIRDKCRSLQASNPNTRVTIKLRLTRAADTPVMTAAKKRTHDLRVRVDDPQQPESVLQCNKASEESQSVSSALPQAIPETDESLQMPNSELDTLKAEDIREVGSLGNGVSGTVFLVHHSKKNQLMALKAIVITSSLGSTRKQIINELRVLHECKSPYIIDFYGSFMQSDSTICIGMEFMDCGSLDRIHRCLGGETGFPEPVLCKISHSVLNGLVYLYQTFKVMHRDIKPSNILVNHNGQVKLCDFGISSTLVNSITATYVGTNAYLAPERIQSGAYTVRADVWSLGMTLVELAIGRFPYVSSPGQESYLTPLALAQLVVHEPSPSLRSMPGFSDSMKDFVDQCLVKDQLLRPSPVQLMGHPFIHSAETLTFDFASWCGQYIHPLLRH